MNIERYLHVASEIFSEADIETLDTYEGKIHHYKNRNYSYIPMPDDGKYYNVDEGWLKDIHPDQIVSDQEHLMDVLKTLQSYPFILVDVCLDGAYPVKKTRAEEVGIAEDSIREPEYMLSSDDSIDDGSELEPELTVFIPITKIEENLPEKAEKITDTYSPRYHIITLADVNRRPVRDMLYKVFSELSSQLSKKIENNFPDSESIFKHMRPVTIGYWWKDQTEGLQIHIAEHMNLIEMKQVIQASDIDFVKSCGFSSKGEVDDLNLINNVRNKVMHANHSLIYNRRDIQEIIDAVYSAQNIISNID